MLDSQGREVYQKIIADPFAHFLAARGVCPNTITLASLLIGFLGATFLACQWPFLACLTLLCSGFMDTLDGSVARIQGKGSSLGAVLDILSDRVVEACIVIGLFLWNPSQRALPCLLMMGSILICVTSFLVIGVFIENDSQKGFHYSPGLMERTEAFTFFFAMALFPTAFYPMALLFTALLLLTAGIRTFEFARSQGLQFGESGEDL